MRNPTIQQFVQRLAHLRQFYDSIIISSDIPKAQSTWNDIHDLMDIDMERTLPGTGEFFSFYNAAAKEVRTILDGMLNERIGRPHHMDDIRLEEMDPGNLLRHANRFFISYEATFGYLHSVACFLYDKLNSQNIASRLFFTSAVNYLARNDESSETAARMNAFAKAAEIPDHVRVGLNEQTDDLTRLRLKRFGGDSVKDVLANEFNIWVKHLCFLGAGDAVSPGIPQEIFPSFLLAVAADYGILSHEWLLSINALAVYMKKPAPITQRQHWF